ncbi:unnamed protein product [Closterium sp. Naga37s-1]|nr:unnamed protein product [Closterium sp. Naga37s-1]
MEKLRREAKSVNRGPVPSSPVKIKSKAGEAASSPPPQPPPPSSTSGTYSAWGLSPRGWEEVQLELRTEESPPRDRGLGQARTGVLSSPGLGDDCGTTPSPLQLAGTRAELGRATELPQHQRGREGVRQSQTHAHVPRSPPPAPAAPPPQAYSPHDLLRSRDRDCSRHAQNHCAVRDDLQTPLSGGAAGTAPVGENPTDAREICGHVGPETAEGIDDEETSGAGSASPATRDPGDAAEGSGSEGRGGEVPADIRPTDAVTQAGQGTDDRETPYEENAAVGNGLARDAPAERSTQQEQECVTAQATQDAPPHEVEEITRARGGAWAHSRLDGLGPGDVEAQAPAKPSREALLLDGAEAGEDGEEEEDTEEAGDGAAQAAMREPQRECFENAWEAARKQLTRKKTENLGMARVMAVTPPDTRKHSFPLLEWVRDFSPANAPAIEPRDFRRINAKLPNGIGAGPSGTTFEHIRDAALGNPDIFAHLLALTNTALAGKLSAEAAELLTASRLLAFTKPRGGTRPIAVGECLLRIVAKAALFLTAASARAHFAPLQFGVAVARGIEAAIHTASTYLEVNAGSVALQIDLANAFNVVERAVVFEKLKNDALESLVPLVCLSYGAPSSLHLDHDFATACTEAFAHLTAALKRLGLEHNLGKCEAWSAAAVDPTSLPPNISIAADGLRVLGSPIGTAAGCAERVRERLAAAAEPLPLLSQMDPQLSLLLLTRCVSRRASFLARTTPLSALPEAEWSAWGERLLHTFLEAAHIVTLRNDEERGRICRQAALPVTLEGPGITNPANEGSYCKC